MSFSMIAVAVQLASTQPDVGSQFPAATASQTVNPLPPEPHIAQAADAAAEDIQADEIVVKAKAGPPPGDPLRALNAESFAIIQTVDKAVTGPVARGYKTAVPAPFRSGLRNALRNLQEPVVSLNYLLQLKPGKSAETLSRFAINSTIGAAGLFDVAKTGTFNLPYRTNGFGYTLGYYGATPGPYMFLPLIGPTTARDVVGRVADLSLLPLAIGEPFSQVTYAVPTTVVRLVDERAEADEELRELVGKSPDPYAAVRANYLRTRQAEIDALRGRAAAQGAPTS